MKHKNHFKISVILRCTNLQEKFHLTILTKWLIAPFKKVQGPAKIINKSGNKFENQVESISGLRVSMIIEQSL